MCRGVQIYIDFYNSRRIHSTLDWKAPDATYGQACNLQSMPYSKLEFLGLSFQKVV